jgi:hypothetical protein
MPVNELSSEDDLCLNVLLTEPLLAVRIDESRMIVHALTGKGEASVNLHPTCRGDQYLKRVREILAAYALGQPSGYPVYLSRWTRMGQLGDDMMEKLLLTGEPEAVAAVVHAPGLTDEIARRIWWVEPTIENACVMLERENIARGEMGPVLTGFLVEHLPFVQESRDILNVVRVLLSAGQLSDADALKLWNKGRQRSVYLLGFLEMRPDALPEWLPPRRDFSEYRARLEEMANPVARLLSWALSSSGQSFVAAADEVLRRVDDQETATVILNTLGVRFALPGIAAAARGLAAEPDAALPAEAESVRSAVPELENEIRALILLAGLSEQIVRPIFARTTAVGALMRTKVAPVVEPLRRQLATLRGKPRK